MFDNHIWTTETWNNLRPAFPNGNGKSGSKILLTMRNRDVALHIVPSYFLHQLNCLNEKHSWELFENKTFPTIDNSGIKINATPPHRLLSAKFGLEK